MWDGADFADLQGLGVGGVGAVRTQPDNGGVIREYLENDGHCRRAVSDAQGVEHRIGDLINNSSILEKFPLEGEGFVVGSGVLYKQAG